MIINGYHAIQKTTVVTLFAFFYTFLTSSMNLTIVSEKDLANVNEFNYSEINA